MNTEKQPLISVLLPVHNSEQYLRDAVESILSQTYKNFELLILISATTSKESRDILSAFVDQRIRRIERTPDEVMVKALHRGIKEAKGKYIARMDSDDISLPDRLAQQVEFMEKNRKIGVCGTWYTTIGAGKPFTNKFPVDFDDIRANMLFQTSFAHPSTMFRKSLFEKFHLNYNRDLTYGEDYDLWLRCAEHFPMANIPKVLLHYRVHQKSASQVFKQETGETAYRVRSDMLKKMNIEQTDEEKRLHNFLLPKDGEDIADFLAKQENWLIKILTANQTTLVYKPESLDKAIYERWRIVCGFNTKERFAVWKKYRSSPLFKIGSRKKYWDGMKILVKGLLKK
ncbi:MAG: glycosyltransferase [Candidatus Pacebacteria bacterium]|jgi:glycosyltransferase involved in cell wall biosynthesis|nr:glycosyltransferase [Candidatus Paceibacterota bacterium]